VGRSGDWQLCLMQRREKDPFLTVANTVLQLSSIKLAGVSCRLYNYSASHSILHCLERRIDFGTRS